MDVKKIIQDNENINVLDKIINCDIKKLNGSLELIIEKSWYYLMSKKHLTGKTLKKEIKNFIKTEL